MLGVMLGALIGALLPGVYALQLILDRTLGTQSWLGGSVSVQVEGQDALLLELELLPLTGPLSGLELSGGSALREPGFPWGETEYYGQLWMRLEEALLTAPARQQQKGWSATYTVTNPEFAGAAQPAPCRGAVDVLEAERRPSTDEGPLQSQRALVLELDLACTHPGDDDRWATGDDVTWNLAGRLELRQGRRPGAQSAL